MKDILPNKLHELLALALEDRKKVSEDPRYKIDDDIYHEPRGNICHVNLSGCVMAKTLGADITQTLTDDDFDDSDTKNKLYVIDYLRTGSWRIALFFINIENYTLTKQQITEALDRASSETKTFLKNCGNSYVRIKDRYKAGPGTETWKFWENLRDALKEADL